MQALEDCTEADALLSGGMPAWVFKHSATCPVSAQALDQVRDHLEQHPDQPAAMVVVQTHRPVSNHVAERTQITHQSPQLMLVRDGRVLWHASHFDITADAMAEAWNNGQ